MKTFLLFAVLIFAPTVTPVLKTSELGEKLAKLSVTLHDTCIENTKLEPEKIEIVKKGVFPEDEKLKKYIACLWLESTAIDNDFNVNYDLIKDLTPPKLEGIASGLIKTCHEEGKGKESLEEKIYTAMKCMYKANPENFVMFRR